MFNEDCFLDQGNLVQIKEEDPSSPVSPLPFNHDQQSHAQI
jgi:hypothetical protein